MSGTRRKPGCLGPFVEGYRVRLLELGYTPETVRGMLKVLGQLGRWMDSEGVEPGRLDMAAVEAFLAARRAGGDRRVASVGELRQLVVYLREVGAMTPELAREFTPAERLVDDYRQWLVADRGLAAMTVLRYETLARRFLSGRVSPQDELGVESLTGADVSAFLLRECGRVSVGSAKGRVAELRSLLRFLYLRGLTERALADSVPPVAGWRETEIPPMMVRSDVERLLACCDQSTLDGVRDFAMLLLLARLGLRSIEVARLELSDVDWRAGEIVVRGKARRQDRLPLAADVGAALAAYLVRRGRRDSRRVFLTLRAPIRAIRADLVGDVVRRACRRAGVGHVGAHRFRHALASELLREGASLIDISQVLRHRDLATTADLRQDRSRATASGRPALARSRTMSALSQHLEGYLRLRRSLGHELADAARLLPRFVTYLDAHDIAFVTVQVAVDWSLEPEAPARTTVWGRRMMAVRGFARYLSGIDPRTEVPPAGLIPIRRQWRQPFIYSEADILALMEPGAPFDPAAAQGGDLPDLIGLLASTGLRVGEALRLDREDIDWGEGVLLVRRSKFGKSRLVPLQPSTVQALRGIRPPARSALPPRGRGSFFVSLRGTRVIYECVWPTHRMLCQQAGVGSRSVLTPRVHDFRHSFAVHTLLGWYRDGHDIQVANAVAVDLSRAPGAPLHLPLPVRGAGAAGARRQAARARSGGAAMTLLAPTLQAFFTDRLTRQLQASPRTIASYRDTLRLLLCFAQAKTGKTARRARLGRPRRDADLKHSSSISRSTVTIAPAAGTCG